MCVVIRVTKPAAEQLQSGPEAVNPATLAAKEKKDDDDDDSDTTQVMEPQIEEEDLVCKASVEEIVEDAVEPVTEFEWYVPGDEHKDRSTNMVTRLAFTAAAHLIMLEI